MEIRLYFRLLKRGWWIISLTILVALVTALAVSYFAPPKYRAIARFIVIPGAADRSMVLDSLSILDIQITSTYAEIMNSDRIYAETISSLQLQPAEMNNYTYEAVVVSNTSVLELTVSGPDPVMAAKLANTIGNLTIKFIGQLNQIYNFDFLDLPTPPVEPYFPNPLLNAVLAIVLGLIAGIVLVVLNEQLRIQFETIRKQLHYDIVTGVYTKKYFSQVLADELAKNPEGVFSIGIVELEGIFDIVDALPIVSLHTIQQRVTDILRKELRGHDVIGRWNEFSFIVLLPNTHGAAAKGIFGRISQALKQPFILEQLGMKVDLGPLIGGAEYRFGISIQELYEKSTNALEQSRLDSVQSVYVWEMKNPFWVELKNDEKSA